jgi:hypothetical protein
VSLSLDVVTSLGVVFDVPRLHGVSPTDAVPWATLKTSTDDITRAVDASNNTFNLVITAEDRRCSDTSVDSLTLGCPNDELSIDVVSVTLPIELRVGASLKDAMLSDIVASIPSPWSKMVSVAVVPALPHVPASVDQLAINVDGYQVDSHAWRIPTSAAVTQASNKPSVACVQRRLHSIA